MNDDNMKQMPLRMEKDNWLFLKTLSMREERSMNYLVNKFISKAKEREEKKEDKKLAVNKKRKK